MNKLNYLFADCVSHRNTLKINRQLNDFFDEEETKFFNAYYDSLPGYADSDDSEEKPKTIIDNWDDVDKYTGDVWSDCQCEGSIRINLKPRMIHYKGYLYRYMSIDEYNKYLTHSLEDDDRDWHEINRCSYNKGYCFIGSDYKHLNDWGLNMEAKHLNLKTYLADSSSDEEDRPIIERLSHVGMIHSTYVDIPKISFRRHVRRQNVLCKFYYDGEIRQSIGYYGEGFCDEWEDNYMIEYGLPNYNNLTLIDTRFDVYDTELYG